ncbi:MAG: DNA adenine methylase [Ramlibacter sp.]|nr:DNA adenine methylase [Ramlibacter sp.]
MKSLAGTLAAPFPYFGGKSLACETVWKVFGTVDNYVEPFAGSAAMLLGAPDGKRVETINDADGFVANFWRAVAYDAEAVAGYTDWPVNEADLLARHSWLVRQAADLLNNLHADPEWFDAKIAGWWCWGACNWIGSGWCSGLGPWVHNGETVVDIRQLPHLGDAGGGVNRLLPHLGNAGQGVNRKLPHLSAGQGVNPLHSPRSEYIQTWFAALQARMRDVRVTCGDWGRVVKDSVTTRHGLTGLFLDPPYTKGAMDYSAGGVGGPLADEVREWCAKNGETQSLRIVLCGHAGEHDALIANGWFTVPWTARKGYAVTDEAVENSASETIWCSPNCIRQDTVIRDLFSEAA